MTPFGLYIHWPFCLSKCPYCDFNSHVREKVEQKRWKEALLKELVHAAHMAPQGILSSIFFGGGTPSLMDPETVASLIETAKSLFPICDNVEITLEANPSTVEAKKFEAFRKAGVNRLSIGVQSLKDEALQFLGRHHCAKDALRALDVAATLFPRFSFDLIYARPHQTEASWEEELQEALKYTKGHLSLYQLTIEPSTAFATRLARGETLTLEEDPAASLYDFTENFMAAHGLPSYEVSNYAAPLEECVHNLLYWNFENYIGIGPGAHGRMTLEGTKHATFRYKAPETWLKALEKEGRGLQSLTPLTLEERLQEVTLMGLRLTQGLSLKRLFEETGLTPETAYASLLPLEAEGLLKRTDTHLVPTREGRLRLNGLTAFLLKKPQEGGLQS